MLTSTEFVQYLHRALQHLYEPDRLRQNPLAALFGVASRLDTFSALQRILTQAIDSLEPQGDEPPHSPAWEIYEPLYYRYVQQLSQVQVARQLGMSVRHLRRKEHAALEVLAARLWEEFNLEGRLRGKAGESEGTPHAAGSGPSVSEELAWLKEAPPEGPADLTEIVPEVLQLAGPLAHRRGVRLEVSMAGHLPGLAVHNLALSQALLNLLGVAIRQVPGGQVLVSASALGPEVEVTLRCTGAQTQAHALTENDLAGLDLARRLAALCRGRLAVSDPDPEFSATLSIPALEQLPVLVIDDNADTLQLLQRYAADTRYRLITTQDPQQALELAQRFSPQIIVLDVMMPGMDGWRTLAQLRQHPLTSHIPVVVCTIMAQQEMALALGASGFVRKPVTRQVFLAALDRQVQQPGSGRLAS